MNERVAKRLLDADLAAAAIERFIARADFATYAADELLQAGVERKLEIVGEALNQVRREQPDLEATITALPRIVGIRNRIAHGYDQVDQAIVWDVASRHLPLLRRELRELLIAAGFDIPGQN